MVEKKGKKESKKGAAGEECVLALLALDRFQVMPQLTSGGPH